MNTNKDGSFLIELLLQDGIGKYTFSFFGTSENSNSYSGLFYTSLESTEPLPDEFNFAYISYYPINGKFKLDSIKKKIGYKLPVIGETDYYQLWYQIRKKDSGRGADFTLLIKENTKLKKYFLLREGKGIYDVKVFGINAVGLNQFEGLANFQVESTEEPPSEIFNASLNEKFISFVETNTGKKIGSGECWDVAQEVLDENSAAWKRPTDFGRLLDPKKEEILPGDIIQFSSVEIIDGNVTYYVGSPNHTAVVYKVKANLHYTLAHQNVGNGRYILMTDMDLNKMVSGSVLFYRPLVGLVNE